MGRSGRCDWSQEGQDRPSKGHYSGRELIVTNSGDQFGAHSGDGMPISFFGMVQTVCFAMKMARDGHGWHFARHSLFGSWLNNYAEYLGPRS